MKKGSDVLDHGGKGRDVNFEVNVSGYHTTTSGLPSYVWRLGLVNPHLTTRGWVLSVLLILYYCNFMLTLNL